MDTAVLEQAAPVKKKRWPWIVLIVVGVLLAGAVTAALILWNTNVFTLTLQMQGEPAITLEYGENYEEPGAQASFCGTLLMQQPQAVEVTVEGTVDTGSLGTYTVRYSASFTVDYLIGKLNFRESCERTVSVVDTTAPTITLTTDPEHYTVPREEYEEEGYTAFDSCDGDITDRVQREEKDGFVYYTVTDASGNTADVTREIYYYDPFPPELKLLGNASISIVEGVAYKEPGYTATDNYDGDITEKVVVSGTVNTSVPGTYTLTYSVTDSYNNTVTATRTVTVKALPPMPDMPNGDYGKPVTPNGKVIYLTFDDGPSQYTAKLLDVLDKYNVKATFFVVNTGYISLTARMAASGHTVAMHSATHVYKDIYSSENAYFNDLYKIQSQINKYTGKTPTIVRFPGGSSNTVSRFNPGIMTRLTGKLKEMGYRYFDWNVDSYDAGGATTANEVYYYVVNGVSKRSVSIVLQHDTKGFSVDAVEKIIQWGLANGYTFLPLTTTSPTCQHNVNN